MYNLVTLRKIVDAQENYYAQDPNSVQSGMGFMHVCIRPVSSVAFYDFFIASR